MASTSKLSNKKGTATRSNTVGSPVSGNKQRTVTHVRTTGRAESQHLAQAFRDNEIDIGGPDVKPASIAGEIEMVIQRNSQIQALLSILEAALEPVMVHSIMVEDGESKGQVGYSRSPLSKRLEQAVEQQDDLIDHIHRLTNSLNIQ